MTIIYAQLAAVMPLEDRLALRATCKAHLEAHASQERYMRLPAVTDPLMWGRLRTSVFPRAIHYRFNAMTVAAVDTIPGTLLVSVDMSFCGLYALPPSLTRAARSLTEICLDGNGLGDPGAATLMTLGCPLRRVSLVSCGLRRLWKGVGGWGGLEFLDLRYNRWSMTHHHIGELHRRCPRTLLLGPYPYRTQVPPPSSAVRLSLGMEGPMDITGFCDRLMVLHLHGVQMQDWQGLLGPLAGNGVIADLGLYHTNVPLEVLCRRFASSLAQPRQFRALAIVGHEGLTWALTRRVLTDLADTGAMLHSMDLSLSPHLYLETQGQVNTILRACCGREMRIGHTGPWMCRLSSAFLHHLLSCVRPRMQTLSIVGRTYLGDRFVLGGSTVLHYLDVSRASINWGFENLPSLRVVKMDSTIYFGGGPVHHLFGTALSNPRLEHISCRRNALGHAISWPTCRFLRTLCLDECNMTPPFQSLLVRMLCEGRTPALTWLGVSSTLSPRFTLIRHLVDSPLLTRNLTIDGTGVACSEQQIVILDRTLSGASAIGRLMISTEEHMMGVDKRLQMYPMA